MLLTRFLVVTLALVLAEIVDTQKGEMEWLPSTFAPNTTEADKRELCKVLKLKQALEPNPKIQQSYKSLGCASILGGGGAEGTGRPFPTRPAITTPPSMPPFPQTTKRTQPSRRTTQPPRRTTRAPNRPAPARRQCWCGIESFMGACACPRPQPYWRPPPLHFYHRPLFRSPILFHHRPFWG